MKLNNTARILLILGIIVSVLEWIAPIIFWNQYVPQDGSVGIIGGADGPTYVFVTATVLDGLPFILGLLGISLAVAAGFYFLFAKTVRKHCSIHTSALSLGLSWVGALGLYCAFSWLVIVSFGEVAQHPIQYPVSILLGMLCLFVFVVLIAVYCNARKTIWSVKGVIIDVLTSIVFLPTFFFGFSYLHELFRAIKQFLGF